MLYVYIYKCANRYGNTSTNAITYLKRIIFLWQLFNENTEFNKFFLIYYIYII